MNFGELGVGDRAQNDGSRLQEGPRYFHFLAPAAGQMKKLGQNGLGRRQGKTQMAKCLGTDCVPAVVAIQKRQNSAGINETVYGHAFELDAPE